jgi:hypothetical protein
MKLFFNFFTRLSLFISLLLPASNVQVPAAQSISPVANLPFKANQQIEYGKLPLIFTANQGQTDSQVAFTLQGSDKTIYFSETGLTFVFSQKPETADTTSKEPGNQPGKLQVKVDPTPVERWALKLDFVGARAVRPHGLDQTDTIVSYFKGKSDDWHTAIPTYTRIVYTELWPGIDLVYSGMYNRLKYEFTLHPGADPSQIRLAYHSASAVSLNGTGQLQVSTPLGDLHDEAPSAYQEVGGQHAAIAAEYNLQNQTFGFKLGSYNSAYPLVIDPAVLVYAGFIGGASEDDGTSIAVDESGAAYITGRTTSSDFPTLGGLDPSYNGHSSDSHDCADGDAFVAKVKPDGSGLVYAGFIGGSGCDVGLGITVDDSGSAYITGETSSTDFPVLGGPNLSFNGNNGDYEAFITKVKPDGSGLVYSGYPGGTGSYGDDKMGITVDGSGAAYVTGVTYGPDLLVLGGPDLIFNGGGFDAFITKVKPDGSGLVYSGYLGGGGLDVGLSIAIDSSGAAYITGWTESSDFPVLGGPDLNFNGQRDTFIVKVKTDGSGLVYSGYLGGSGDDMGYGVAVDGSGAAYITGETSSSNFPTLGGPDLSFNGGYYDAFIAKLKPDGSGLVYSGYLGGNDGDYGWGIALDNSGAAYITGFTSSSNFPVLNGSDLSINGGADAFIAKLKPDGSGLVYASYLGGSDEDYGESIAVDSSGAAYVSGWVWSTNFPVIGGPELSYNGGTDAFVAKISPVNEVPTYSISGVVEDSSGGCISDVTISDGAGHKVVTDISGNYTINGLSAGTYTLTASKSGNTFSPATRTLTIPPDMKNQDFTATLTTYVISGRVLDSNSKGIADVSISTGAGHLATTNINGSYTMNLTIGTYTLTPSKIGFTFSPLNQTVTISEDKSGVNFIGTAPNVCTLTSQPNVIPADGSTTALIQLQGAQPGHQVQIISSRNSADSFNPSSGIVDATGSWSTNMTSSTAGDATLSVVDLTTQQTLTCSNVIHFLPVPIGSISSPIDGSESGLTSIEIYGTASYPGGDSVKQVEFYVKWDGEWHSAGAAITTPYTGKWDPPSNLNTQTVQFRMDVVGLKGSAIVRTEAAGGVRNVTIKQSISDPNITEAWVPNRVYLNQRALQKNGDGDSMCSATSMAMVLAMEDIIGSDNITMANEAYEMYQLVTPNGRADQTEMKKELVRQGLLSSVNQLFNLTDEDKTKAWNLVKSNINAGHPFILDSRPGTVSKGGHFIAVVGYKEAYGVHTIIAYDPFGQWKGKTCSEVGGNCGNQSNYYLNINDDFKSHVGQWVYYDFDKFPGYEIRMITAYNPTTTNMATFDSSSNPPDVISDEPRVEGIYDGVPEISDNNIYLPIIIH